MTRTSAIRVLAGLLIALLVGFAAASSASAGQLTNEAGTWVYRAAPGENNDFRVALDDQTPGHLRFGDAYDLAGAVPAGCYQLDWEQSDRTSLRCQFANVRAELGDNDGSVVEWGIVSEDLPGNLAITIDGGPGVDRLTGPLRGVAVTLLGGEGNDEIHGGRQHDVLDGGPGNDRVDGAGGNDVVRGGDGDDTLSGDDLEVGSDTIDGGPGLDAIRSDWIQNDRAAGQLAVSLDGVANDGHGAENDNVVGIERLDLFEPATLVAGGDAVFFKLLNTSIAPSKLVGGSGGDTLIAYDSADEIDGAGGNDAIEGGYGDDRITGGAGQDAINADAGTNSCNFLVCRIGSGNDTVNVRDGAVDSVVCGPGQDTVTADAGDTIASDCEVVDRGAAPPERRGGEDRGRAGGRGRGRSGSAKRCVVPKVRAGAKVGAVKKALGRKGCKAATKKVRSAKVRRGRVVKLSQKAGKKLAYRKTVTVYVSRGRR